MPELSHPRIEAARHGENPAVICKMPSGWAILCDMQYLSGYTILFADPLVPSINTMQALLRSQFLADMVLVGDALMEVTGAYRINYAILGNSEPLCHAHIVPRYLKEPENIRSKHPWDYPREVIDGTPLDLQRDTPLILRLKEALSLRLS